MDVSELDRRIDAALETARELLAQDARHRAELRAEIDRLKAEINRLLEQVSCHA
jgi:HAMP domain-containing protein